MKKSQITKRKILEAAEIEFSEKGFYGTRVDEIAKRSNINKRMLYVYFGNKETLYATVLSKVYNRISVLDKVLQKKQLGPVEVVKSYISSYFNFLKKNPTFVKLIMRENLDEGSFSLASTTYHSRGDDFELLKKILEKGIQEKVFKPDIDIKNVILSMNMFCFSYFSNIYTMSKIMNIDFNDPGITERRCLYITDLILQSILL